MTFESLPKAKRSYKRRTFANTISKLLNESYPVGTTSTGEDAYILTARPHIYLLIGTMNEALYGESSEIEIVFTGRIVDRVDISDNLDSFILDEAERMVKKNGAQLTTYNRHRLRRLRS